MGEVEEVDVRLYHRAQLVARDILAGPEVASTKRFLNDDNSGPDDGAMEGLSVAVQGPGGELLQAEGDAADFVLQRLDWEQNVRRPVAPSLSPAHQPARDAALDRIIELLGDASRGQWPQNPAAAVLRALVESGVPASPLHDVLSQWSEHPPEPRNVVMVLSHQAVGGLTMGSAAQRSKASAAFKAVTEAHGVPACDPTFVFLPLAPSAQQQATGAGGAPGPGAPPGYRDDDLSAPGAVEAIRSDMGMAMMALQLCRQFPVATLLLTPLGAPAILGRELRDEELYHIGPFPLVPELQMFLPSDSPARYAVVAPHPTCVVSVDFTWMPTLRMFLRRGGTLPPGKGCLRGMLAAWQHTLCLDLLVWAVSICLKLAGYPVAPVHADIYRAALWLLRGQERARHGWQESQLYCLAQPEGVTPGLMQLLLELERELGITYVLVKEGALRYETRSEEACDLAAACPGLRQQLQQQREVVEKEMAGREQASSTRLSVSVHNGSLIIIQAADSARPPPCSVRRAVGKDTQLMLADGRPMPAYLLQPGDFVAGGRPGRGGVLPARRVLDVEFVLVHRPLLFKQNFMGKNSISAADGIGFAVVATGTVGVVVGYNTNGLQHQWATTPMGYNTNGLQHQWATTPMGYNTNGLQHQWATTPMGYNTNGLQHQWATTPMGYNTNDETARLGCETRIKVSLGNAESWRTVDTDRLCQARLDGSGTFPRPWPCCEGSNVAILGYVRGMLLDCTYAVIKVLKESGRTDVQPPCPEKIKALLLDDLGGLLGLRVGDGFAATPAVILNTADQVALLAWLCRVAAVLGLRVAVFQKEATSAKFLLTTNSGTRRCTGSELLGLDGKPTGEAPFSNENNINLLTQWSIAIGFTYGSSRAFSGLDLAALLTEGKDFLLPMLAFFYAADGGKCTLKSESAFSIIQGRFCGHESLALFGSKAGLRCGLGGLLHAKKTALAVKLRGPVMAELNPLVPVAEKRLDPAKLAHAVSSVRDVDLRHYCSVERVQGWVMCVAIKLEGGPAEVRTADGVVLQLG